MIKLLTESRCKTFGFVAIVDLLFSNYPYLFIEDGKSHGTLVVLPDKLGGQEFAMLENLVHLLENSLKRSDGEFEGVRGSE
ncbi:hypothetical protein HB912_09775 [Listeria aquatica]|uniref:Uncharacterized protein n=1 Tax=Listeria aquatica TaxID=1494960 RepID=A0A841ZS19_9LIST|nr:hypothetical protein [Listeria aquatica]MBC1521935.1 hypothetical protein [Listeria aquatica]